MQRMKMMACSAAAIISAAALLAVASEARAGGAGTAFELEHARANARAGGPISDYDAELLERWGNSTGGPDWRKQYYASKKYRDRPERSYRYKSKSRVYYD